MTNPHLSITTTALFPNIGRVNALLRQFFEGHRLRTAHILDLRIAAEEILSNIARPGRIVKDPNRLIAVLIVVELSPTECVMCFEDDADPANPLHAPVPNTSVPLKDRPPGGLGIHLVRADGPSRL